MKKLTLIAIALLAIAPLANAAITSNVLINGAAWDGSSKANIGDLIEFQILDTTNMNLNPFNPGSTVTVSGMDSRLTGINLISSLQFLQMILLCLSSLMLQQTLILILVVPMVQSNFLD